MAKIFLDTNPIIYVLDSQQKFHEKTMTVWTHFLEEDYDFCTSVITDSEFLILPFKKNDSNAFLAYQNFLDKLRVSQTDITKLIAKTAAELRAKYVGLKLADSLQLASSIVCDCDVFLTNDKRLKQVTEANVLYLGDM